ncbi:MAG: hypothetical protein H6702_18715 [Myxococcales bacterium]|nr:hypothetical protein [Myxococcales bacterium]
MVVALLGHTLAGVLGGLLAGLVDALPAGVVAGPRAFAGGLGLGALLGGLAGALWGLAALGRPVPGLRGRLRAAGRLLWPRPDHALHDRTRTVATGWVVALALWAGAPLLAAAVLRVMGRLQSALFAGLAVALVALAVVGALAALALALRGVLARALEALARRWPRAMAPLVFPAGHAVVLAVWIGLQARAWAAAAAPETTEVAVRLAVALAAGAGTALLALGPLRRFTRSAPAVGAVAVMLAGTLFAAALLRSGLVEPGARAALAQQGVVSGLVARAVEAPSE